jgi:class 3 adenylate cyclase/tetratricopeptide (TPR) repeat protein
MAGGHRKLAAIMFTDMVGFSALAQRNERVALALLEEHRGILRPLFARFRGREVKTMGDGFLVEFDSALDATECGVEIQRSVFARNRRGPVDKIEVRVGIHEGDVVRAENDLYGDAVNIAARIEPLAEPGGIAVTGPVYEQVRNKLAFSWAPIERASLKNIEFPVSVYRIELPWLAARAGRLTPFVDRSPELEAFQPLLKAAGQGEGIVFALGGEPGVGKTRLAEELAQHGERLGFRLLRARGHRGELPAPYSYWAELVRQFAKDAPNALLYKVASDSVRELVQLVPELAERLGPGPPAPPVPAEQERTRFFEGIARFFENVARESPVILLLDDLQWGDIASLRVLGYLGQRTASLRLVLLLTYRDNEVPENTTLREVLDELSRAHRLALRTLRRFDPSASAEMIGHLLGEPTASVERLIQVVQEKTGGNPFFLESVIQSLIEEGKLVWSDEGWLPKKGAEIRLPENIRSLIRQRTSRLDEAAVTTLRVASVLGSEFTFDALARLTELPEDQLLVQLELGLQHHLMEERPVGPGSSVYAFVDFQIRDTLYDELSLVRRSRYHRKAGEILESLPSPAHPTPALDLAQHFLLGNDLDRALKYTLQAADEAVRIYAREEALRQYTTAHELLEPFPEDSRRLQVTEKMAEQLNLLGKPEEALTLRRQLADEYERLGHSRAAGNLHRLIAREFSVHNEPVRAREHWEKARTLLESGPESKELARLYDTMGGFLYEAGKSREAIEMYAKAIRIAEAVGDWEVQAMGQTILAALLPLDESTGVFDRLDAALHAAKEADAVAVVPNVLMNQSIALLHIRGDGRGALRKIEDAIEIARRNHNLLSEMMLRGNLLAYTHYRIGDLPRAARVSEEFRQYAGDDPRRASATANLVLADVALVQGHPDRADPLLWDTERLLEEGGDWVERVHLDLVFARRALHQERPDAALERLESAYARCREAGPPALNAVFYFETASYLIETLLDTGALERAEARRAELMDATGRFGQDLGNAYSSRAEGMVAHTRGDGGAAMSQLERSVELWRKLGWGLELSRARLALARACEKFGHDARASSLREQAREFLGRTESKEDPAPPTSPRS